MGVLGWGDGVLALTVLVAVAALCGPTTDALFVDKLSPVRQVVLGGMTPIELHHYFGDASDPVFHLTRPRLVPDNARQQVRLTISSADFHLDSVLASAEGLLASHLLEDGITVGGETVTFQICHFRSTNATHVITINNCDGDVLNGIIVTPDKVGSLHPMPSHLVPLVRPLLPHSYFNPAPNCTYGLHILHFNLKRTGDRRAKREASRGGETEDEPIVCATGPEHDVTRLVREIEENYLQLPRLRDLSQLIGDVDPQAVDAVLDAQLADHNHTVTANPVSAVVRRTVELAVFCDSALYRNFPLKFEGRRESQISNYVLTIINAVQGIYHQKELQGYVVDLLVVQLDIFTDNSNNNYPSPSGGDIGAYLSSFCAWQRNLNPADDSHFKHWDHSLMLSGLDLHSSGNPSVIGLAWVGGMCQPSHSCTMNEGLDFSSVYVVAHEMGHNFGMNHDGQGESRGCSSSSYIMSPSVGPGKTTWSTCSVKVMHSFLRKSSCLDDGSFRASVGRALGDGDREAKRMNHKQAGDILEANLKPKEVKLQSLLRMTPGYQFPLPEQCKAMYGRDYHPALTKEDLCKYLYCTNGVVTRPAHAALEGSFCGSHRVCIAGNCRPEEELVNLLAYNIPSPNKPHESNTKPTSLEENIASMSSTNSPPVSSIPSNLIESCSEKSAAEREQCINGSSLTSPCSCILLSTLPEDVSNIPKEICPFLAPVFHELFNCSSECPQFNLYLDLISGNSSQMLIGPSLLKELSQSCDNIVKDQDGSKMIGLIPFTSPMNPEICKGLPHFLHSSIGCSYVGSNNQSCSPQNIILKSAGQNISYIHSGDQADRIIMWKGKYYSQTKTNNVIYEEFLNNCTSFTIQTGENDNIVHCNFEATFPKVLQDLTSEVCPFLAPILHRLFNCPKRMCVDYVIVINLKENNVTKLPLKTHSQPGEICPACKRDIGSIYAILSKIMQVALQFLSKSTFICELLPDSLKSLIPSCSSLPLMESISEDTCPPVAVMVEVGNAAFTYSLNSGRLKVDIHQLKWHGKFYDLHNVTSGKDPLTVLKDQYSLDIDDQVVRKYDSKEMQVSHTKSDTVSTRPLDLPGHFLQEYVGQSDRFLPLNAPMAMPRTKIGKCSVTCGRGIRIVELECVDVLTEEILDSDSCQGYAVPKPAIEECKLPDCHLPQWKVEEWGTCQQCGNGVQFRQVQCIIPILESQAAQDTTGLVVDNISLATSAVLVVKDKQCMGERPQNVQGCHKVCSQESDPLDLNVEIAKDFDY